MPRLVGVVVGIDLPFEWPDLPCDAWFVDPGMRCDFRCPLEIKHGVLEAGFTMVIDDGWRQTLDLHDVAVPIVGVVDARRG